MTDLHNCCTTTCSTTTYNVVSWDQIKLATTEDGEMQNLMKYIMSGFPEDAHAKPYNTYKSALYIVDMLIMFGERVVVPLALRQSVLHLLHAAHQGVDRMKARFADVVFWHGIVGDLPGKERHAKHVTRWPSPIPPFPHMTHRNQSIPSSTWLQTTSTMATRTTVWWWWTGTPTGPRCSWRSRVPGASPSTSGGCSPLSESARNWPQMEQVCSRAV